MIESKRLMLRKMTQDDFDAIAEMLRDAAVMYAWEHTFDDEGIREWIRRQMQRYETDGTAYLLAVEKQTSRAVGQIGVLKEEIGGETAWGVGYLLNQKDWGKGYAAEGAKACMDYAFSVLGAERVICDIRPSNTASIRVAERLGMRQEGEFVKHYNGKDMLHRIYAMHREQWEETQ